MKEIAYFKFWQIEKFWKQTYLSVLSRYSRIICSADDDFTRKRNQNEELEEGLLYLVAKLIHVKVFGLFKRHKQTEILSRSHKKTK